MKLQETEGIEIPDDVADAGARAVLAPDGAAHGSTMYFLLELPLPSVAASGDHGRAGKEGSA
jgi:hypothetical protein